MKKGKRMKHHHHSLSALLLRYSHLTQDQMATAIEADVLLMVSLMDAGAAALVMDKIARKLRSTAPQTR